MASPVADQWMKVCFYANVILNITLTMTLYLAFVKLMMIYKVRKQNYTDIQQKKNKNEKNVYLYAVIMQYAKKWWIFHTKIMKKIANHISKLNLDPCL